MSSSAASRSGGRWQTNVVSSVRRNCVVPPGRASISARTAAQIRFTLVSAGAEGAGWATSRAGPRSPVYIVCVTSSGLCARTRAHERACRAERRSGSPPLCAFAPSRRFVRILTATSRGTGSAAPGPGLHPAGRPRKRKSGPGGGRARGSSRSGGCAPGQRRCGSRVWQRRSGTNGARRQRHWTGRHTADDASGGTHRSRAVRMAARTSARG